MCADDLPCAGGRYLAVPLVTRKMLETVINVVHAHYSAGSRFRRMQRFRVEVLACLRQHRPDQLWDCAAAIAEATAVPRCWSVSRPASGRSADTVFSLRSRGKSGNR